MEYYEIFGIYGGWILVGVINTLLGISTWQDETSIRALGINLAIEPALVFLSFMFYKEAEKYYVPIEKTEIVYI